MMRVLSVLLLGLAASALAITLPPNPEFDVRRVIPGNAMQGITFTPNGDLYMSSGHLYCKYPNAANLPIGSTLGSGDAICGTNNKGSTNIVSTQTGRIYDVHGYEIDKNTWAPTQRWKDCGATHGIAIDPRDGAVFVGSVISGEVWRIPNPDTNPGFYNTDCVNDKFFDAGAAGHGGFDAITIAPDGTFYGAGYTANKFIVVSPWSSGSPQGTLIAAKPTINASPDGVSICVNNGNSFALVAMTGNRISKFNLTGPGGAPAYAESTVATNVGGYLDFSAVDPKGCIWGTTLFTGAQGVYRVTNADHTCGCASAQVPDPDPEPEPTDCPNCANKRTVVYQPNTDQSASAQSPSRCVTLVFA